MITTTVRLIKKYAVISKVSFANSINYRSSLITGFVMYSLFIYIFMSLWRAIYQGGSVQGYTYVQIVWYLTLTELIGFFAGGPNIYRVMNDDVKTGSIAYILSRPVHYIAYQLASSLGQIAFNFIGFSALAVLLGFTFAGPLTGFSFANLPAIFISVSLGITLDYLILMLVGLSAFFLEDNLAMYLIVGKIKFMLGAFLPVEFLPDWLQPIAKSLPFSYICWAPAKLFVDFSSRLFVELVSRQAMWTGITLVLLLMCFKAGTRRLQINGG